MSSYRFAAALLSTIALAACSNGRTETREADEAELPQNPLVAMQPEAARSDARAAIFLTKGCPQCHALSAYGLVSPTNVGPDLSTANADVRQRFNVPLEQFLRNPTGTMQIVLSGQIQLSPVERDSIVGLLRQINTTQP